MIRRVDHRHRERIARIMRRASITPTTCWTGKMQHRSEHDAAEAIKGLRRRGSPDAAGLVAFKCDSCSKWHTGHGLGNDP